MSSVDDELRGLMRQLGVVDHGGLGGLLDDDHTQYLKIDGTRAMTGNVEMDHIGIGRAPTATHLIITGETFVGNGITVVGIGNFPTYAPAVLDKNIGYAIQGNIWFDTQNWDTDSVITGLMFFPAPNANNVGSAELDLAGIITGGILNVGARTVVAKTITGIACSPFSSIFGAGGDVTADIVWGIRIPSAIATTGAFGRLCGCEMEPQTTGTINQGFWFSGDGIGSDLCFGAGDGDNADANIYYDGTDLIIDPKMIGTGSLKVEGDIDLDDNELKNAHIDILNDHFYYVATDAEFDAAITDIETNNYRGTIHIIADLTNVQATFNDASAEYIIDGHGHHLDPDGNNAIFTITNALKWSMRDCYIDCTDYTAATQCIDITEANDNPIIISHNTFYSDDTDHADFIEFNSAYVLITGNNFIKGRNAITARSTNAIILGNVFNGCSSAFYSAAGSDYCIVAENTIISAVNYGIYFATTSNVYACDNTIYDSGSRGIFFSASSWCNANGNILIDCADRGIQVLNSSQCVISNNQIDNCDIDIAQADRGGIILKNADECTVIGNIVKNCNNADAGNDSSGIYIDGNSDRNICALNIVLNNDAQIDDSGTNQITDHNIVA